MRNGAGRGNQRMNFIQRRLDFEKVYHRINMNQLRNGNGSIALNMKKPLLKFSILCSVFFLMAFCGEAQETQTNSDYAAAAWVPIGCNKFYTSGNGHKFVVIHDMEGYYASSISYLNSCALTNGNYKVQ